MKLDILYKKAPFSQQPAWLIHAYQDLQLDLMLRFFPSKRPQTDRKNQDFLCGIWTTDYEDIRYRNQAIRTFCGDQDLWNNFEEAVSQACSAIQLWEAHSLKGYKAIMTRFYCALHYVKAIQLLKNALQGKDFASECLRRLRDWVDQAWEQEQMEALATELEEAWKSVSPVSSVQLSVHANETILTNIVCKVLRDQPAPTGMFENATAANCLSKPIAFSMAGYNSILQNYVQRELESVQRPVLKKLQATLSRMSFASMEELTAFCTQWRFYDIAISMVLRMEKRNLPMTEGQISQQSALCVEGLYPLPLALEGSDTVGNTVNISGFALVTGGNQTGKTQLILSVGQLQWLFQCGFLLPCTRAELSLVQSIHTLFATGEGLGKADSRMGFETERLKEITDGMGSESLVLLNEPLTATNASEAVEICASFLKLLSSGGVRGMMATHYINLYHVALMDGVDSTYLDSLVMHTETDAEGNRQATYRAVNMSPNRVGTEHMVEQYGLSLSHLMKKLPDGNPALTDSVKKAIDTVRKEVSFNGPVA